MRLSNEIAGEPVVAGSAPQGRARGQERNWSLCGSWAGLPGPWVARIWGGGDPGGGALLPF